MPDPKPWNEAEMILHACRAIGKVDRGGQRGIERVTYEEIAAMAGLLVCVGFSPIPPAATPSKTGEC